MTRSHAAVVLGAFAFGLLAVGAVPPLQRDRVVDPAAWVAAAREVDALAPGTVVLVHPPWRDDVAAALRAAAAHDSLLLHGATITTAFAPQQGAAWPPLVVLRERGGVPLPRALRRAVVATTETANGLVIASLRVEQPPPKDAPAGDDAAAGDDLLADPTAFHTELTTPRGTIACPFVPAAQRHECTDQPQWMHQGRESLSVDGQPVTCMWAHPPKTGALVFRLADRLLLGSVRLELALSDTAAQTPNGAAVTAQLRVGDARGEVTRQGVRGFASTRVSIPPGAARSDIVVEVTTPNDAQRHACIRLYEERAGPALGTGGAR